MILSNVKIQHLLMKQILSSQKSIEQIIVEKANQKMEIDCLV